MAKKQNYYQRYVREGRRGTIYCCKQFKNVYWREARQLVKDYSEKSGMRRTGRLRKGKCPSEYGSCR
jgi:hypothetical protein